MRTIRLLVLSAVLAIVMATLGTGAAAAATGPSELTVTIQWGPGAKDTWSLRCDPVGGTHPNRVRACAFLDSLARPFSALPTGMACTMIYSGPERAHVVGQWRGRKVDTTFARNDGCATARWRQYRALVSDPATVSVTGRVDLGPTCPVQRPGESCEIVGAPATVTATSGTRIRRAQAGANGFVLRLSRGVWAVTADAGMHCPTVRVDTRTRPVPWVLLSCDTGIRAR